MGFMFLDRKTVVIATLVVIGVFIIGILLGYFAIGGGGSDNNNKSQHRFAKIVDFKDEQEMVKKVMENISAKRYGDYLKTLTKEPHIAAQRRDKELTDWIQSEWKNSGLDRVEVIDYDMYLSWPNQTNPNKIYLMDPNGNIKFTSKHQEEELRKAQKFICPEPNGTFEDFEQCDKYYECFDNVAETRLCPDGLVFDPFSRKREPCDHYFNVDCGDRLKLQTPRGTNNLCPRLNGFYAHPDPTICNIFYACVEGVAEEYTCSPGLWFDEYSGVCNWPTETDRNECSVGDDHPEFVHAFNGYAPPGEVEGDLVYVNYARVEDLRELEDLGVSVEGKICIARYGKIYRGNKVRNCQDKGAIAVIMYTDPKEVAVQGTRKEDVYPNSIFLPGSGVQRGSTFIGDGDPLTPTWASVDNAYRMKPEDVDGLPKIPAQPIGYDDAKILLEKMGGKNSPDKWKGKLEGIEYRLGGEMLPEYEGWKVKVKVNNYFGRAKSGNIIGYIKGEIEPDRYVLLSNHRDAWGYGSVDPSSGTAQLMEVVRSLGDLHKQGWKPRRTIVFCSWAAEEYGLLGSYEWAFHKINKLMSRSIGLLNTDICVSGPIAKPQASPVLKDLVVESFKHSSAPPNQTESSYYEYWENWTQKGSNGNTKPKVKLLASGTDHAAFAFYGGIPSINNRFKDDTKKHKGVGQYPTYHTGYETFYLMEKIIDPGFELGRICAQSSVHVLMNLADSKVIPYNLRHFSDAMTKSLDSFEKNEVGKLLTNNGVSLYNLKKAVNNFKEATETYMDWLSGFKPKNELELRIINDQLMQLERVFIIPGGLPDRPTSRHAIFAPAKFNSYGASSFPGISDLLHEIEKLQGKEKTQRWESIKKHVSDLMIMVQNAADFLQPVDMI